MYYGQIINLKLMQKHPSLAKLLIMMLLLSLGTSACGSSKMNPVSLNEGFDEGTLDQSQWIITKEGDFTDMSVDIYDANPAETIDQRLRLRANTIGTSDSTVKSLGVRYANKIDISEANTISFDLDWNDQTNGSYLSAGIYLCPEATETNPADKINWISFEYIGVPPGKNARFQISLMKEGNLQLVHTEGWPDQQRTGREINDQKIELIFNDTLLTVKENSVEIFSGEHLLDFTQAYLYLQMNSHSNYPSREVYFDNIQVNQTHS